MSETLHFLQACTLLPFTHPHLLLIHPPSSCSSFLPTLHLLFAFTHLPPVYPIHPPSTNSSLPSTPPFHPPYTWCTRLFHPLFNRSSPPLTFLLIRSTHSRPASSFHRSSTRSSYPPTLHPLLPSTYPAPGIISFSCTYKTHISYTYCRQPIYFLYHDYSYSYPVLSNL